MFDWIVAVSARLGYVGVALLTFLENVFPPIPSELVIPLAGFVAARGELQIAAVIAIATAGSLAGATAWYVLGQRIGEPRLRRWVGRHGKWLTLSARDVDTSNDWFRRHGRVAVLVGRLVPGVRTFISLPAGFSGMPLAPFLAYSALGTVIWTGVLAGAGVVLQANFSRVGDYVNVATDILLAGFLALLVYRYIRCWRS